MNSRGGLLVLSLVLLRGAVACSDTPLATPASDGNYDDEGAPGNMNDPGGSDASARDAARDSTAAVDAAADAAADVAVDSATDAQLDAEPDAAVESDADPDADTDAGD